MTHPDPQPPVWMHEVIPGTLDARVLDQEHHWVTIDGTVLAITDREAMGTAHLENIATFLLGMAVSLHLDAMLFALADLLLAKAAGQTTAEAVTHHLTGNSIATTTAEQYIEATPLLRAIRREVAARSQPSATATERPPSTVKDVTNNEPRTELRLADGGLWAIRSSSPTTCYLDLDTQRLYRDHGAGSPPFPYDHEWVPLVRVTSTRGDEGIIRIGDRHTYLTDPAGAADPYRFWIPRTCTTIEPVDPEDLPPDTL